MLCFSCLSVVGCYNCPANLSLSCGQLTACGDGVVLNHTQVKQVAYDKYLKEVMTVLMADKEFANKVYEAGTDFLQKVVT